MHAHNQSITSVGKSNGQQFRNGRRKSGGGAPIGSI